MVLRWIISDLALQIPVKHLCMETQSMIDKMQKIPFNYQSAPLDNEAHAFDFYLVDGRYRVATACSSFLHAISRGGDMSRVMVGVHS